MPPYFAICKKFLYNIYEVKIKMRHLYGNRIL